MPKTIKLIRKFRLFTLLLFFWGAFGLIVGQIEISTSSLANLFALSCLMMVLDFIVLKYNLLIYLHHFLMLFICLVFFLFINSMYYEDNEALITYVKWAILVTNTSWIKSMNWKKMATIYAPIKVYAILNIILVSIFAYHFSNYFVAAPIYYLMVALVVLNIVLSYLVSFKILHRTGLFGQQKSVLKSE